MDEIDERLKKYSNLQLENISRYKELIDYSRIFYSDVAVFYDTFTRIKNVERNPSGYDKNDAAILGLLVRIWKIFKEITRYYNENNADLITLLDRQLIESAVVAKYLLISDESVIIDYRKCAYKNRIKIIEEEKENPDSYSSPPGKRLINSIIGKLRNDSFELNDFQTQKKNKWKIQGLSFYDIFTRLESESYYKLMYGLPSESIHGSWNNSVDFNLQLKEDGTYIIHPFYHEADIRYIATLIRICHDPFILWFKRIDIYDEYLYKLLQWIKDINYRLIKKFEPLHSDYESEEGQ